MKTIKILSVHFFKQCNKMVKKHYWEYSFLILMCLFFACFACSKDKDTEVRAKSIEELISQVEGTYIGKWSYHEQGKIIVTKQSNGLYSVDAICEKLNLNNRIEDMKINYYSDRIEVYMAPVLSPEQITMIKYAPEYWEYNTFNLDSVFHLNCMLSLFEYGSQSAFYFFSGDKTK